MFATCLTLSHTMLTFNDIEIEDSENIMVRAFSPFPTFFSTL